MTSQLCIIFNLSMDELNDILYRNRGSFDDGSHYFKLEGEDLQEFNDTVVHDSLSATLYVWTLDAIPLLARVIRSQTDKNLYSNKKDRTYRNTSNLDFKTIDVNGKSYVYKTYTELCEKVGVPYDTFIKRRRRGLSLKESLDTGNPTTLKPVIFKGQYFESKAELCRRYNVKYKTFTQRQSSGYTLEECVFGKEPKPKQEEKVVETIHFKGIDYKDYGELAEAYGIPLFALYRKLHVDSLTLEESIENLKEEDKLNKTNNIKIMTEKERKKDIIKKVEFNGKEYTSARELSSDCGVAVSTLKVHLKRGLSVEEIQDKVKKAKMKRKKL